MGQIRMEMRVWTQLLVLPPPRSDALPLLPLPDLPAGHGDLSNAPPASDFGSASDDGAPQESMESFPAEISLPSEYGESSMAQVDALFDGGRAFIDQLGQMSSSSAPAQLPLSDALGYWQLQSWILQIYLRKTQSISRSSTATCRC